MQGSPSEQGSQEAKGIGEEKVEEQPEASTSLPKCFLVIHSVSKRHNVGNLLRSATAFGVAEVCIIGSKQFNTFGSQGACDYVTIKSFPTLKECCHHLKVNEGCEIIGVEIMEGAKLVESHPFSGPTAFILGNEGSGLSEAQMRHCDSFTYINQYGPGTASLNVYVAASIVLHHFALWAGYSERSRTGGKFDLGSRPLRTTKRGQVPLSAEEFQAEQERRRLRREGSNVEPGSKPESEGTVASGAELAS